MGITYLDAKKSPGGVIEVRFGSYNRGAVNWQALVNDFEDIVHRLPARHHATVEHLDPDKSLGRGARIRMHPQVLAYVIADWERCLSVTNALRAAELTLNLDAVEEHALARARRRVAERANLDEATGSA